MTRRRRNRCRSAPTGLDRPDLAEVLDRHRTGLDEARPQAVARRRERSHRTARENVADLVDAGSLIEYGPLVLAAQRRRREMADLIENTPADGLVGGIATVNGGLFEGRAAQCVVMSYDYTVLAGTQGTQNHRKKDRLFELAEQLRLPIVFFTEGGGGRPGDTDGTGVTGLDSLAFMLFAELSGLVPLVARERRLLLRRQRGDPRVLRRRDRHRGLEHRHGRSGDDRRGRARRLRTDGGRADRGAACQRRGRHRGARRGGGACASRSSTSRTSRARSRRGSAPTRTSSATSSRSIGSAATTCGRRSTCCSTPAACSSSGATSASA